jgi:multisubunit Na+/H+ antiporter MnhC subunit
MNNADFYFVITVYRIKDSNLIQMKFYLKIYSKAIQVILFKN